MMWDNRRRERVTGKRCISFWLTLITLADIIVLLCTVVYGSETKPIELIDNRVAPISPSVSTEIEIEDPLEEVIISAEEEDTVIITEATDSANNSDNVYPYSLMSADWGVDIYGDGFTYYQIPESYVMGGGMFPEVAQAYLWCICKEAGVDYYMVLALIERESGYQWDATGDSGKSKGLMQIQERWHTGRMEALGVEDLYNPYSNMLVGVNYLKEIQDRYLASSGIACVLMVYNMGEPVANNLWEDGIYSTDYANYILHRAQEIKQEIQDQ